MRRKPISDSKLVALVRSRKKPSTTGLPRTQAVFALGLWNAKHGRKLTDPQQRELSAFGASVRERRNRKSTKAHQYLRRTHRQKYVAAWRDVAREHPMVKSFRARSRRLEDEGFRKKEIYVWYSDGFKNRRFTQDSAAKFLTEAQYSDARDSMGAELDEAWVLAPQDADGGMDDDYMV